MQTGFKKVLNFRKNLINIGCQLDFQSGALFYGFLTKTLQGLKIHHIKVIETDKSEIILHHKSFSNNISVDLICLRFANVILTHLTGLDGVQHTHLVKLSNKVSNKVVTVVCRRRGTDDDAVPVE
jgi:hypothetical protein